MSTFQLGPLVLSMGQLLLLLGFVVALVVGAILGRRHEQPVVSSLSDILLISLLVSRLVFVIVYFEFYRDNLLGILDIRDGGFHLAGGLAGLGMVLGFKLWRHPAARRPLLAASLSGVLVWALSYGLIRLIHSEARGVPELTMEQLDGEAVTLSEMPDGLPMVVNIWASWCPPCRREMPVLESAQDSYPGVRFVFVNHGEGSETVTNFLHQQDLSLENMLLDRGGRLGRETGNQMLPTTLFYNAGGRLVNVHWGELSRATLERGMRGFQAQYRDPEFNPAQKME